MMVTEPTKRDGKQKKHPPREVLEQDQAQAVNQVNQPPKLDHKPDKEPKEQATLDTTWDSVVVPKPKPNPKLKLKPKLLAPHKCHTLKHNYWNSSDPS